MINKQIPKKNIGSILSIKKTNKKQLFDVCFVKIDGSSEHRLLSSSQIAHYLSKYFYHDKLDRVSFYTVSDSPCSINEINYIKKSIFNYFNIKKSKFDGIYIFLALSLLIGLIIIFVYFAL